MSGEDLKVAEADSRTRCQAITVARGGGQCIYEAVEGTKYCKMHGGQQEAQKNQKENIRNLNLMKFRFKQDLERHCESPKIKSLREEVGVLRIILEQLLERIKDENDLLMSMPQICGVIDKINLLVSSCHKLEQSSGQLLDKAALMQFASQVVQIIGENVTNMDTVQTIANSITQLLAEKH